MKGKTDSMAENAVFSLFIYMVLFRMSIMQANAFSYGQEYKLSLQNCSYLDIIISNEQTTSLSECALKCTELEKCKAFGMDDTECKLLSMCPRCCNASAVSNGKGGVYCIKGDRNFILTILLFLGIIDFGVNVNVNQRLSSAKMNTLFFNRISLHETICRVEPVMRFPARGLT